MTLHLQLHVGISLAATLYGVQGAQEIHLFVEVMHNISIGWILPQRQLEKKTAIESGLRE